jgi:FlaG/FlaF family flagellin (archaellin)
MVAITVILAAVIGTFVLGLGDQVQETSPNAQWNWDEQSSGPSLLLTHEGGDSVNPDNVEITNSDSSAPLQDTNWDTGSTSDITAGSSYAVVASGDTPSGTYRLIWQGQGSSSTLSTYEP